MPHVYWHKARVSKPLAPMALGVTRCVGITGHLPRHKLASSESAFVSEHFQNHLAAHVARLAELVGMARFGQRQHGFDNGLELSRIDQLCKLSELHG